MTNDWYCNTSKSSAKWTSASAFKSYIISNEKSSKYGIHGKSYAAPDKTAIGDYVYMPGHVMFITKVDDTNGNDATDFSEIYISAHTSNRLDKNLKALYSCFWNGTDWKLFLDFDITLQQIT